MFSFIAFFFYSLFFFVHSAVKKTAERKYATRLNAAQRDALKTVMKRLDAVAEKEAIVKKQFERKMLRLRDELCEQMSSLTLQKEKFQNNASEIMSATAVLAVKPLNGVKMQRQLNKLARNPAKPQKMPRKIVPYTQANLTDALVHLAECHYRGEKYSLRKAAAIYMDGKYASLTRLWNANRIGEVLKMLPESEGIEFVASIPKPRVRLQSLLLLVACCLLLVACCLLACR